MGENHLRVNGNDIGASGRGTNILVIDKKGNKIKTSNFDTYGSPTTATDNMISFIETTQSGRILLFAFNDHAAFMEYDGVAKIESLGSKYIRTAVDESDRNNWAFITVKGGQTIGEEYAPNAQGPVSTTDTLPDSLNISKQGSTMCKINEIGPAPESLVGWWPLDGNTKDYAGPNNGTNNGASVTSGLGQSAYDFERSNNDYIDVGVVGNDFAVGRGDFTFSAWLKFESFSNNGTIFELSRYTDALLVRPDNGDWTIYMDNSANDRYMNRNISASTEEWVHFLITRRNGTVEMYEDASSLGTNNMDGLFEINQESYIGMSVHSTGQNHDGELQDIRFYDRALSDAEVEQLYAITDPRKDQRLMQTEDGQAIAKEQFSELL